LLQKWKHKIAEWEALPIEQQERIIGRTKLDSIELENKPSDSHVARTDQDEFGTFFRRNMPYGSVDDHGTMFVGYGAYAATQSRSSRWYPAEHAAGIWFSSYSGLGGVAGTA
jgi:putative iron-dependent peroxidase